MGAGCYYTHNETRTRAFWVEVNSAFQNDAGEWDFDPYLFEDTISNLREELETIGWDHNDNYNYSNGFYDLYLESTYGGDGIVFRMEPLDGLEPRLWGLAMYNFDRSYDKIARHLVSQGYNLRIATSGYTSGEYLP